MTNPSLEDLAGPALPLSALLAEAAVELDRMAPPPMAPRVGRALTLRPRGGWRRVAAWGFSGAVLCGLALLGSLLLLLQDRGHDRADHPGLPSDQALQGRPSGSGFVAVAGAERWQQLMQGDGAAAAWVVPSELPRERLAALGLPYDPARAGERVRAELLLHSSGEVLAVRVLNH